MVKIKLGDYLDEKKISVSWLHQVTGIRYATLMAYVHNHSQSIKFPHLGKIMKALNINDVNLVIDYDKNR